MRRPVTRCSVLPADMPFVHAETVARVIAEQMRWKDAVVATSAGRRGHPIVLPEAIWRLLLDQSPESTLKNALVSAGALLREIPVDDPGVLRDVDEPRDLE